MQTACASLYFCHLWLLISYHIFPHYIIDGTIFGKKVIERRMCVLIFSAAFVCNTSDSKNNSAGYYHKCT